MLHIKFNRDRRPARGDWSPGTYLVSSCDSCGNAFIGGEEAHICAECAYERNNKNEKFTRAFMGLNDFNINGFNNSKYRRLPEEKIFIGRRNL